jgi:hypothetical protein
MMYLRYIYFKIQCTQRAAAGIYKVHNIDNNRAKFIIVAVRCYCSCCFCVDGEKINNTASTCVMVIHVRFIENLHRWDYWDHGRWLLLFVVHCYSAHFSLFITKCNPAKPGLHGKTNQLQTLVKTANIHKVNLVHLIHVIPNSQALSSNQFQQVGAANSVQMKAVLPLE